MITCKLGDKEYFIDYVSGRALREIGPALKMFGKINAATKSVVEGKEMPEDVDLKEAMDVFVRWFCILFNNQFTPDDVYDKYPVDSIIHDMTYALVAVQSQTTDVLSEFPMKAAQQVKKG